MNNPCTHPQIEARLICETCGYRVALPDKSPIELLASALVDLQRTVLPTNPNRYRLMAEPILDEIAKIAGLPFYSSAANFCDILYGQFADSCHPKCPDPDCAGRFDQFDDKGRMILDHSEGCLFATYMMDRKFRE